MPANESADINPDALKHLFGKMLLTRMGRAIGSVYSSFDELALTQLFSTFGDLEMKARVFAIRNELKRQLPANYPRALKILLKSIRKETLRGFDLWPYTEFIQTWGLGHWQLSLDALKILTVPFTSEFAVRPFLVAHPRETLNYLLDCAREKNPHVRRWASEGTRPRLPWGERLTEFIKDPTPTFPILEALKYDAELYVRKSVSNHLNDITKDHPERVTARLARWKKKAPAEHVKKIDWIIHRSLRSLIKKGNPDALKLIGISQTAVPTLVNFKMLKKVVRVGEKLSFSFLLKSATTQPQKVLIDYLIHFNRANKTTSPKVFKLKTVVLNQTQTLRLEKKHSLKKITTRVFYAGTHFLEIQINGVVVHRVKWELILD
jgi:3-methyladenine DNA glycosylase AlkC